MRYRPDITEKQIEESRRIFVQRMRLYREKGLDFDKSRHELLEQAGGITPPVLETGSGKGITAIALGRAGHGLVSVDNDIEALRTAALNLAYEGLLDRVDLRFMDACRLGFKDSSFGTVFMVEALHHMDEEDLLFGELHRVLKPGGKIVLSDFNKRGFEVIDRKHREEGRKHSVSGKGRDEAKKWLMKAGYRIRSYDGQCHWGLIAEKAV
jgi:SAM-dependent methyltransferase